MSSPTFRKDYKKIKDKFSLERTEAVLKILSREPFDQSIRTHQVNIHSIGKAFSSRVTGDLRLIWRFDEDNRLVIIALRLQGHDTVYK